MDSVELAGLEIFMAAMLALLLQDMVLVVAVVLAVVLMAVKVIKVLLVEQEVPVL
jgi:hypothetical protein